MCFFSKKMHILALVLQENWYNPSFFVILQVKWKSVSTYIINYWILHIRV